MKPCGKKQILIVSTSAMYLGGIETSLIGLLDALDYERCDVDLFLFSHRGELLEQIPPQVNVLPLIKSCDMLREPIVDCVKSDCLALAAIRLFSKFFCLLTGRNTRMMDMNFRLLNPWLPKLKKRYDLALGFFGPHDFLVNNVNAKVKVGWIHTDYSKVAYDMPYNRKNWLSLDYIAAISDESGKIFANLLPEVKERIITVENVLPRKFVKTQAAKTDVSGELSGDGIKLLTVGRFSHQKRMDEIPQICRLILAKGLNVTWYLIGYGPDEALIRQRITESGMEKHVIILGKKANPYPYIKSCDVYVQPSRYEGKCVAVREAQMLGKAVIITNYPTAHSQLTEGFDGKIVPMEINACAEGITQTLQNKELLSQLSKNCRQRDYSNRDEVGKLMSLLR